METIIVSMNEEILNCGALKKRVSIRNMSADDMINNHLSGTLRKNKKLGMAWKSQYLEERIAYEYGWEFECQPKSRVMFGDSYTEGDCHSITEAGWHIERYIELSIFPEDKYECKYINVEYSDGTKKEGIGIIIRETSSNWIPQGHIVFTIIAEYNTQKDQWEKANNPF